MRASRRLALTLAGFLLSLAGWAIVLAAVALLKSLPQQGGFALAGVAVEVLGLILVARAHLPSREEKR